VPRAPVLSLALLLVFSLSGCGSALLVTRTETGGVLKLDGFRSAASKQADELMTARCDGPYTVVAEGDEFVAGTTEYRMHFVCGGSPPTQESRVPDANRIGLD
jgi:hypothetical protein